MQSEMPTVRRKNHSKPNLFRTDPIVPLEGPRTQLPQWGHENHHHPNWCLRKPQKNGSKNKSTKKSQNRGSTEKNTLNFAPLITLFLYKLQLPPTIVQFLTGFVFCYTSLSSLSKSSNETFHHWFFGNLLRPPASNIQSSNHPILQPLSCPWRARANNWTVFTVRFCKTVAGVVWDFFNLWIGLALKTQHQ